jgi:AraC-like DNA-binding protein
MANPAIFWLFASAVFDDASQLRLWHVVALIAMVAVGMSSYAVMGADARSTHLLLTVVYRVLSLACLLGGLWIAFRGRAADLLEHRRRLRDWLTAIVGAYMLIVVAVEISLFGRQPPIFLSTLNIAVILVIAHTVCHGLAKVNPLLLDAPTRNSAMDDSLPESQRQVLERLRREIEQQHCYRQEGLSIAALADKIGTQEYVLRRVINQGLGFRNFNEFLHSYRIRDACERLRQAGGRKPPVLTIALEVGYSSVGPFNRAFKEMTGMTPTEYRQKQTPAKTGDNP